MKENTEVPHSQRRKIDCAHFEFLEARLNANLVQNVRLSSDSFAFRVDNDSSRVVDMHVSQDEVCAPLVCPTLLHQVLQLLPKNLTVSLRDSGSLESDEGGGKGCPTSPNSA